MLRSAWVAGMLGCGLWLASACQPAPAPKQPVSYPPGTVLALNGVAISTEQVDQVAAWFARLEPRSSLDHLRRLALTNVIFPRIAAGTAAPQARVVAQQLALEYRRALAQGQALDGPLAGPVLEVRQGRMLDLGMEIWNAALDLPPGQWSEVLETAGAFHLARLKRAGQGDLPALIELEVEVYDFPYLDPSAVRTQISEQLDRSQLESIDPAWLSVVPISWQYRLRKDKQTP